MLSAIKRAGSPGSSLKSSFINNFKSPSISSLRTFSSLSAQCQEQQAEPYKYMQLPNKVSIATNPLPGHFAALGVYINAGSRFEDEASQGVSHLLDKLAFGSTKNYSGADMQQNLAILGGTNIFCSATRESIMYQASVFNKDVPKMCELLSETIVNPKLTHEEIEAQKSVAAYEIDEIWKKPELILPELFHIVAYSGQNLGSPLLCPPEKVSSISKSVIEKYRTDYYNPENATVAFVGVSEDEALKLTEKHFGSWTSSKAVSGAEKSNFAPAVYTGGELSLPSPPETMPGGEFTYVHIGFEGLAVTDDDIYALAVLQMLLGGGGSFSAGGPGKGMYARLYTQVLNRYGFIENCMVFNHSYVDSGLFGISAACIPNAGPYTMEIICQQLSLLFHTGKNSVTLLELNRSKNQLKSSLLMNLESKLVELEDLGRQVQVQGYKIPLFEMIEKIDKVDLKDIKRVAERVLTGQASKNGSGKPTILIQGNRDEFGDIDEVIKRYGLGKSATVSEGDIALENEQSGSSKKSWW